MNADRSISLFSASRAAFLFLSLGCVSSLSAASTDTNELIRLHMLNNMSSNGDKSSSINATGMAAMHSLAGEKAGALIFRANPKSWQEGVQAGLLYRALDPIGNKISETINQEVGDLWNAVVGGLFRNIKESILYTWYWLFNGGAKPFISAQLQRWKKEVLNVVLHDLDRNAKESQRESTTGRNSQMRALFDASGEKGNADAADMAREKDPVWQRIVDGYGRDLERLARRLEVHKLYYAPQDAEDEQTFPQSERYDIIQLTNRLQEGLRLLKNHILLPSGTLKELAEGETRYFLPQLRNELEKRFDLLISSVHDYHGTAHQAMAAGQNTSSTSSSQKTRSAHSAQYL